MTGPFPTVFAIMISTSCDLYIPDEVRDDDNMSEYLEKKERLIVFQQISVAADFKTALEAYYDFELSEYQVEQLLKIHNTTKSWLLGYVAGNLLQSLQDVKCTGRDKKEIATIMVEHFIKINQTTPTEQKGLFLKFAGNGIEKLLTPPLDAD